MQGQDNGNMPRREWVAFLRDQSERDVSERVMYTIFRGLGINHREAESVVRQFDIATPLELGLFCAELFRKSPHDIEITQHGVISLQSIGLNKRDLMKLAGCYIYFTFKYIANNRPGGLTEYLTQAAENYATRYLRVDPVWQWTGMMPSHELASPMGLHLQQAGQLASLFNISAQWPLHCEHLEFVADATLERVMSLRLPDGTDIKDIRGQYSAFSSYAADYEYAVEMVFVARFLRVQVDAHMAHALSPDIDRMVVYNNLRMDGFFPTADDHAADAF